MYYYMSYFLLHIDDDNISISCNEKKTFKKNQKCVWNTKCEYCVFQ